MLVAGAGRGHGSGGLVRGHNPVSNTPGSEGPDVVYPSGVAVSCGAAICGMSGPVQFAVLAVAGRCRSDGTSSTRILVMIS
jgi:hypothetical protein